MIEVKERMREFKDALRRYTHLLKGGKIDLEKSVKIEEIELSLIEDLLKNQPVICRSRRDLQDLIGDLLDSGWIEEAMRKTSEGLNVEIDGDPKEALEAFLTGNVEKPEGKIALLVVQAIARCLAESKLEDNEIVEEITPICPVCGAESKTMVLERDGYYMVCPFCSYKWLVSRDKIRCPYCGNDNPVSLGVFSDRARRLGLVVCQECGATWRLVIDKSIKAPRILLPVISLGAEAYRQFIRDEMVRKPGGQQTTNTVVEGGGEEA
ncbi:MAG: formate dehydrogenase accessory protein FdhE [Desulfurococcales archaeon]|nr:formate dehydrogenase accessory protein FdhE [Desulfurococcales archaeon]